MADKLGMAFAVAEAAALVSYVILHVQLLLFLLPAIAAAHLLRNALSGSHALERFLTFAVALSERYSATGSMAHSLESTNSRIGSKAFTELHKRHMLGDTLPPQASDSGPGTRLADIISFSMRTGKDAKQSLSEFRDRTTSEIETANMMRSKAGSMKSVTYAGLTIFLPLFGGVSSSIISSLYSVSGAATQQFLCSVLAYVALALFITAYTFGSERSIAGSAMAAMPLLSISSFVLFFTSGYISQAL